MPNLSLSGNRSDGADFLVAEGVDDGGFASVRVPNKADRYLLAVGVEAGELAEELDEGALAEGVGNGRVEGEGGVIFRQCANPSSLDINVSYATKYTIF